MEDSLTSCNNAQTYPRNLADHKLAPYALDAISYQLQAQASRLFADESQAALDFLDLGNQAADFWPRRIKNVKRLKEHLGVAPSQTQASHRCRFLFVHAAHSRDRLNVSGEMLMLCFTHFQVMPEFVEFLLPFGFREYAQDFHFSGFRQRTQLIEHRWNAPFGAKPADKKFQICWNLKSVEPSDCDEWSTRQCAIYHSFHLEEVRPSWIIIKGNELMKRRVESATSEEGPQEASNFDAIDRAFEASLETHLIFCRWSAENWRWYINSIEDKFQNKTRNTFSAPLRAPTLPTADTDQFTLRTRTNTWRTFGAKSSISQQTENQTTQKGSLKADMKNGLSPPQTYTNPDTGISQPLPPDEDEDDDDNKPGGPLNPSDIKIDDENREFSFNNLRELHKLAEKANEAVLSLKQNIIVLAQLREFYSLILTRQGFPKDVADSCKDAVDNFELCIEGLEHDMQTHVLRLETLLRLMEEHQLHSILDYQNTQANKYSTRSMFTMTEDMNDIARKTKIETTSMKVITLVTLFFLPGTFISVGRTFLSTLMSTEIFQADATRSGGPDPYARLNPIQVYLALSLPLTVAVLLFWACFHLWEMRHEKQKKSQHKAADWQV
ncbi:hypothetical protein MMC18_004683 [Xylographa bjoerkii]|nr:hypothetical protein [Xylographa bjoerkii]